MERLFRDRMEYLKSPPSEGCFICEAAVAESGHQLTLYRGTRALAMLNKFPYNTGHIMVAPFEHCGDITGLQQQVVDEIMVLLTRCVGALKDEMQPQGFNIGANMGSAAGAGVPDHFHLHVVPRWGGDTNFMPVLASTKVLPETLEETYSRLAPHFQP
ncbi:MAG: HIT family protein [Actinomycetota bacterium]